MTVLIDKKPYETMEATKRMRKLPNDVNNEVHMFVRRGQGLIEPRKIQTLRRMLWNTVPTYDDKSEVDDVATAPNSAPNELLRSLL